MCKMLTKEQLANASASVRIGRRIAAIRVERQMTQLELAKAAGISRPTVNLIENGKDCRLSMIEKIEKALQATLILVPNEDLV